MDLNIDDDYQEALTTLYAHYGREIPVGTRMVQEGDHSTDIFFLLSGMATVFIGEDPQTQSLWVLEPGDFFGELALLDNLPRTASVEAMSDCQAVVLDRQALYTLLTEHPALAIKIIQTMGMRMRKMDAKYKRYLGYLGPDKAGPEQA